MFVVQYQTQECTARVYALCIVNGCRMTCITGQSNRLYVVLIRSVMPSLLCVPCGGHMHGLTIIEHSL